MRRSIILTTILAATVAILGACDPKTNVPNKPAATPTPAATATPQVSPTASPTGSPAKLPASPEAKKPDAKKLGNDANPAPTGTPKAK